MYVHVCCRNRAAKEARLRCNNCLAAYVLNCLTSLMEPVDVYARWLNECKKENQGMFKKETTSVVAGDEDLDYEVPQDDAWQERDDEAVEDDEEEEDGDFEPPSKKRNEDSDADEDAEELRKVQEALGNNDAKAVLKDLQGDDSDDD